MSQIHNTVPQTVYLKLRKKVTRGEVIFFLGQAGIALLYMKLGRDDKAAERLRPCFKALKKKRFRQGDNAHYGNV
jgi:hypothetical protein